MNQAEYTHFYKGMRAYAKVVAKDYFHGEGQLEEAVDVAMGKLVDWLVTNPTGIEHRIAYIKTLIRNSIKRQSKERKVEWHSFEAVYDSDWSGKTEYQKVNRNKSMKVRIDKIISSSEKQIMEYYSQGMRQVDIVRKLKISKQYVSKVVKKWTV